MAAGTEPRPLPDDVAQSLRHKVFQAQRDWRAPSVVVRVVRRGQVQLDAWAGAADLGSTGPGPTSGPLEPGPDVQYRMGSITKTFTAALVLQARDDGLLDLDDRLDAHLQVPAHGEVTLRRMLCHLSGLQREPVGEVWESLRGPDLDAMLADLAVAEAVLSPQQRWHYSNLAYALLGQVAATVRGTSWEQVLRERLLDPLGLTRTTTEPTAPVARGYFVDPYADRVLPEPLFPGYAFAPAAELWTTSADLARWAAFWAEPDESVLKAATVAEMTHLHAMADLQQWTLGWGLGLMLHRRGERFFVGHDGAMPGFLASMVVHRDSSLGVVALTSTSRAADPLTLAVELAEAVLDAVPELPQPWLPGPSVPADVEGLLGTWWTEGMEFAASWRSGDDHEVDGNDGAHLELQAAGAPASRPPARLRRDGSDRWRVVSGREQGELLRVVRGEDGVPTRLYWATYPMTRLPLPFGS
ncbi:serine hydrolase domain-containing protein [Angustibacter sp. McL0619]|uniref:serine hydrolase domain-containing protein n=1 Tax=Angustibacter sp. McL0619 TaxID=3415676 RepID=UPI003CED05D6